MSEGGEHPGVPAARVALPFAASRSSPRGKQLDAIAHVGVERRLWAPRLAPQPADTHLEAAHGHALRLARDALQLALAGAGLARVQQPADWMRSRVK